jgi:ubiquinol-cytochrome c reductase cytochrome c1 subunit
MRIDRSTGMTAWTARLAALVVAAFGFGFSGVAAAAAEGDFEPPGNDINNTASLQRGARNFMNYCSGCHSAQYVRYNRIAADLGIPESELKANLMFVGERPFDTIKTSMTADDARKWFGNLPPDLSLIARSRGTDYIYAFLRSFYADESRPTGVNNTVLPGTAMPHVLSSLQGVQTAVFKDDGHGTKELEKFELTTTGTMKPAEYDEFVRDTVNFLQYIGEPVQAKRQRLGVWVMLFLLLFTAFAYLLYKEYWKDVH